MPVNSFDNYPMSWKPSLDDTNGMPKYLYLADQLKNDILEGKLTPGTKLPPQRELADYLDINLSTVTRAFKLCEQRGLICSIMGSGTFVSSDAASKGMLVIHNDSKKAIQMGPIMPNPDMGGKITEYLKLMSKEPDFYKLLQYASIDYDELQIIAAKKWMNYLGMKSEKDNIIFSAGSQNGIFAVLATLFKEGDRIATTHVTYPGLKTAANILGIQVVPLPDDGGKITKESLEYVYKNQNVKGFYFIPDFNNPSSERMDLETRKMIAEFMNEKKLPFVEDCIYTLFQPKPLPPISQFSKEYGIIIASVSKVLSPGLRLAVIHAPKQYKESVATTLYAMEITPPQMMMQLFARLVNSGIFDEIRALRIKELEDRNRIFDEILGDTDNNGDIHCPIRWLKLREDDSRSPLEFENELLNAGVHVYGAERFMVGSAELSKAIRISLITEPDIEKYKAALKEIRKTLVSDTSQFVHNL